MTASVEIVACAGQGGVAECIVEAKLCFGVCTKGTPKNSEPPETQEPLNHNVSVCLSVSLFVCLSVSAAVTSHKHRLAGSLSLRSHWPPQSVHL